ncbi:hypothetical protein L6452_02972 [Arctium lappa]|uniref:Uncharacterized protein n=1 Tax=Arctium lappa TaxID=4217 RepID=A0ACB9FKC7_ARCLA|nr:hypothetical protein L6452_02972 [Arctium lappa]
MIVHQSKGPYAARVVVMKRHKWENLESSSYVDRKNFDRNDTWREISTLLVPKIVNDIFTICGLRELILVAYAVR